MLAFVNRCARVAAGAALVIASVAGGCVDPTVFTAPARCPNAAPMAGGSCQPGLVCHYAESAACANFFTATCGPAGLWEVDHPCGAGGGSTGGGDPEGGSGGEACVDPVEGPPALVSPSSALYPPDTVTGSYQLQLSEKVDDVQSHLTWNGPGQIDAVTKVGQAHLVRFSGLAPGESATLLLDGAVDTCGTPMAAAAEIAIAVRPRCHYLGQDFEGDYLAAGWSSADEAGDGNEWAASDAVGQPNHSGGDGACATTNGAASPPATSWDARLSAPVIDLAGAKNVALRYKTELVDTLGSGVAYLEASPDGVGYTALASWSSDHPAGEQAVDLGAYAGGPLYLRWRYENDGGEGAWWDVDEVCVEEYTKVTCPCPSGGYSEQYDVKGSFDGNGSAPAAEPTLVMLSAVGNKVTVCGTLEDDSASGPDFFTFTAATPTPAGPLGATVSYCIESALSDATAALHVKTQVEPVGQSDTVHGKGSFSAELVDGSLHVLSLAPGAVPYNPARYSMTVELTAVPTPIIVEGFETWPPPSFTVGDEDPCLDWGQALATVVPAGVLPPEGQYLAYFNSYDCSSGSESLESKSFSLAGMKAAVLFFDMFHDTEYPESVDTIQVEYNTTGTWIPIGEPIGRPAELTGWATETVDLTPIAGQATLKIRLRATSAYGTNVHIDKLVLLAN